MRTPLNTVDMTLINQIIDQALGRVFPAFSLEVRQRGQVISSQAKGWLDPETRLRPVRPDTRFDLASVTKLFVTTAFMSLVETGQVTLEMPVCTILPQFSGLRPIQAYEDPIHWGDMIPSPNEPGWVDASQITFRHLLTHTSGLPAWRPLFRQADADAARQMALNTSFFYPTRQRITYSDIGLILLGLSIEKLTGLHLDEVVHQRVTAPLGLSTTGYLPLADQPYDTTNIAPTEECVWRKRRIVGEVHDENAARLGGISGHAGLFSTAHELAVFGQAYLVSGAPLLLPATIAEMTRLQAEDGATRRGLGFALWSPDPEASGNPFSQNVFGHTGFTGTSLWIDPTRELVVSLLTNRVYYGRDAAGILEFRVRLHQVIVKEVDSCSS